MASSYGLFLFLLLLLSSVNLSFSLGGYRRRKLEGDVIKTGSGNKIVSGSGTKADPFNKPYQHENLNHAFETRKHHQEAFPELYEGNENAESPIFVPVNSRKLKVASPRNLKSERKKSSRILSEDESCGDQCNYWEQCWEPDGCPDRIIPCRDCPACADVPECSDAMFICENFNLTELPESHPCVNENCEYNRVGQSCLDTVFDYCCDESVEGCDPSDDLIAARNQHQCTLQGCSSFLSSGGNWDRQPDYSDIACPFSNSSICDISCENEVFKVYEAFNLKRCEGPHCLNEKLKKYAREQLNRRILEEGEDNYGDSVPLLSCGREPEEGLRVPVQCDEDEAYILTKMYFEEGSFGKCLDDFENPTSCKSILTCFPEIMKLFSPQEETFEEQARTMKNVACFAELIGCTEFKEEFGLDEDTFEMLQDVYYNYGVCTGEVSHVDDSDWKYNATCQPDWEGGERCGSHCCNFINGALEEGIIDFGSKENSSVYVCSQVSTQDDAKTCVQEICSGCFEKGGGPFGPPMTDYDSEKSCVASIYEHCLNEPNDPPCQAECPFDRCDERKLDCPCDSQNCASFYSAPYQDRVQCEAVQKLIVEQYVLQGFLQPEDEWIREELEKVNALHPISESGVFNVTQEILDVASSTQCNLLDELLQCTNLTISYCNTRRGYHSQACASFSQCGDGILSWGERCDDGNSNSFSDGCTSCDYVEEGYVCPKPGVPCEKCQRTRDDGENSCPFCLNQRINFTSPCLHTSCKAVSDFASAKECDGVIMEYCEQMEENGFYDPGCERYTPRAPLYTVPRVKGNCTVDIRDLPVESNHFKGVKIALIECQFFDPYGEILDATPYVPYQSLKTSISTSSYDSLNATTRNILDLLQKADENRLVPLYSLTDHELSFRTDARFADIDNIHDSPYEQMLARIDVHIPGEERHCQVDNEWCSHPCGDTLEVLSPSDDMMLRASERLLKKFKFEAFKYGNHDYNEFLNMNLSTLDLEFTPKKNSVQFARVVSRSYKHWENNREVIEEWPEEIWSSTGSRLMTWEEALLQGYARINFGDSMFQKGCQDKNCEFQIAHCESIPVIGEMKTRFNVSKFDERYQAIEEKIEKVKDSKTWEDLRLILNKISLLGSSDTIASAIRFVKSVAIMGTQATYIRDVENYCPHWWGTDEWESDPCCNWMLREYQCCPLQDVPNGNISIVEDFDYGIIQTSCANPEKVSSALLDLTHTLNEAIRKAEAVAGWSDMNQFEEIWQFDETCRIKIEGDGETGCNSDGDCFCSYSRCKKDWSGTGRCETDESDMYKCYAQCFHSEYEVKNPILLSFMKDEWKVSNQQDEAEMIEAFEEAWGERMTEEGCAGPMSWQHDIGWAGYEWICDSECQNNYTCSIWEASYQHLTSIGVPDYEVWQVMNDADMCEGYGGNFTCHHMGSDGYCHWGECFFDALKDYDMPCYEAQQCRGKCDSWMWDNVTCAEEKNGTFINNMCCPGDKHIWTFDNRASECRVFPQERHNAEAPWIHDETCCDAAGGSWKGYCCLGEWKFDEYSDTEYCNYHYNPWDEIMECHEGCQQLDDACGSCYQEREQCCDSVYVSQNKTACLSYTACNDQTKAEYECQETGSGWCGEWGWPIGESATCRIYSEWTNQDCASLGGESGETSWGESVCVKPGFLKNGTVEDCMPDVCPIRDWSELYPGTEEPENGAALWTHCSRGCYVKGSDIEFYRNEWYNPSHYWETEFHCSKDGHWGRWLNSSDACLVWTDDESTCDGLNGTFLGADMHYSPPRFQTRETCETGYCEANFPYRKDPVSKRHVDWHQPWSAEQCQELGVPSCNRWCPVCSSHDGSIDDLQGACFNSTTEEHLSEVDEEACANISSATWYTCPEVTDWHIDWQDHNSLCQGGDSNMSSTVRETLGCHSNWKRCPTEETCNNAGWCEGTRYGWVQLETEICMDPDWQHGDKLWGYNENVENENGVNITSYEYVWCNEPRWIEGICIKSRGNSGCDDERYHQLGCLTNGLHNESACEAAGVNYTWYDKPTDEESCNVFKGCKQNWHVSYLNEGECDECGGDSINIMRWNGGTFKQAYNRPFTWYDKVEFGPQNQWIKTQATYKLHEELLIPILRSYAQNKAMQLSMEFGIFKNVLRAVACDCDGSTSTGNVTECFDTMQDGSISGSIESFAGCTSQSEPGPGTFVGVSADCSEENRRLTETNSSSIRIYFTHVSVAGHPKLDTCSVEPTLLNTLVVQNDQGVYVGQLIGDGIGINTSDAFGEVSICLEARQDISVDTELFDTVNIAFRDHDGGYKMLETNDTLFTTRTFSKVCYSFSEPGEYFPMLGVTAQIAASVSSCSNPCEENQGFCVAKLDGGSTCKCACGFSGSKCQLGCKDNCNGNGVCNDGTHVCTCPVDSNANPIYLDDACSKLNCPKNPLTGEVCSGAGTCSYSNTDDLVICTCDMGYDGVACDNNVFTVTNEQGTESGYGEVTIGYTEEVDFKSLVAGASSTDPNPTAGPSVSPDTEPPSSNPTESQVASEAPSVSPTVAPRPIVATLEFTIDSSASNKSSSEMKTLLQGIGEGVLKAVDDKASNGEQSQFEVEVVAEVKEECALTLDGEPTAEQKPVFRKALQKTRCGITSEDNCKVELTDPDRILKASHRSLDTIGYTLQFTVTEKFTSEYLEEKEALNETEAPVGVEDAEFLDDFLVQLNATSVEEQVSVPVITKEDIQVEKESTTVEVSAEIKYVGDVTDTSALESIESVQNKSSAASDITDSIADTTGDSSLVTSSITVDLCAGLTCSNQGTCNEGKCSCDPGYIGVDCSKTTSAPSQSPIVSPTHSPTVMELSIGNVDAKISIAVNLLSFFVMYIFNI